MKVKHFQKKSWSRSNLCCFQCSLSHLADHCPFPVYILLERKKKEGKKKLSSAVNVSLCQGPKGESSRLKKKVHFPIRTSFFFLSTPKAAEAGWSIYAGYKSESSCRKGNARRGLLSFIWNWRVYLDPVGYPSPISQTITKHFKCRLFYLKLEA